MAKGNAGSDSILGIFNKLFGGGGGETVNTDFVEESHFTEDQIDEMAKGAKGRSATVDRITRVAKHLDEDEFPQYFNKGGAYFGLRIEGGDEEIRKGQKGKGLLSQLNNVNGNLLVVTDKRVMIVSMQATGDDVHSIPYDSISGIDSAEGVPRKISIQTNGRTYHLEIGVEDDDIGEVIEYIRESRLKSKREDFGTGADSSLEKLEKLGELKERGIITVSEFEEKKKRLLEEL